MKMITIGAFFSLTLAVSARVEAQSSDYEVCMKMAFETNKTLPIKIDPLTTYRRMICVEGKSRPLAVYEMGVLVDLSTVLSSERQRILGTWREAARAGIKSNVCSNLMTKAALEYFDIRYIFLVEGSGELFDQMNFTMADCG